jgi:hypothetical protein
VPSNGSWGGQCRRPRDHRRWRIRAAGGEILPRRSVRSCRVASRRCGPAYHPSRTSRSPRSLARPPCGRWNGLHP